MKESQLSAIIWPVSLGGPVIEAVKYSMYRPWTHREVLFF